MKPSPEIMQWMSNVVYIILCTSNEKHYLWEKYHKTVTWKQDNNGYMAKVGELGGSVVNISLSKANLNGEDVLFVEDCSQVVDHRMIDAWLEENLHCKGPSGRLLIENSMGLRECINYIKELAETRAAEGEPAHEKLRKVRIQLDKEQEYLTQAEKNLAKANEWLEQMRDKIFHLNSEALSLMVLVKQEEKQNETNDSNRSSIPWTSADVSAGQIGTSSKTR